MVSFIVFIIKIYIKNNIKMKELKLFDNYSQYVEKESMLGKNSIASTNDNDLVYFKPSYILTKNIVDVRNIPNPDSLSISEDSTVSSSAFGRRNENSITLEEYRASKPMLMNGENNQFEDFNNYSEGSVDVDVYVNSSCYCAESSDNNIWITKPFNHAKIVFQQEIDPSNVSLSFGWEDMYASVNCENCLKVYYDNYYPTFSELINNGFVRTEDNITFEFVDYNELEGQSVGNIDILAEGIYYILYNYGYQKAYIDCYGTIYNENLNTSFESFIPFSLIIDDVYTINYNWRERKYTYLQVLGDGFYGFCLKFKIGQVSRIEINNEKMSSVRYGYDVPVIYNVFDIINGNYNVTFDVKIHTKADNMNGMFVGVTSLKEVDFIGFVSPQITYMSQMFMYCCNLTKLHNLDKLDTSMLVNMGAMFAYCSNIKSIDLSSFNTKYIDTQIWKDGIIGAFGNCHKLLDVKFGENYTLENAKCLHTVFDSCWDLPSLDLSAWDTTNVTEWYSTFNATSNLTEIIMMGDVSNLQNGAYMFSYIAKEGIIIYNKEYEEAYQYFIPKMSELGELDGWQYMSNEDIFVNFVIVNNSVEVSEGTVTVNGIECEYNQEYNCWTNIEPLLFTKEYVVSLNGTEVGSFTKVRMNKQYVFVGDNISSYEGFNINATFEVTDTDDLIKLINGQYQQFIGAIVIDDTEVIYDIYHKFDTIGEHTVKMLIDSSIVPLTHINGMFYNCHNLKSITIQENFDTSMVSTCHEMFTMEDNDMYTTPLLTSITMLCNVSNITEYYDMFYGIPENGTFTYACAYDDMYQDIIEYSYLPSSWSTTCQATNVTVKLKLIENGSELTSGNVVVNNTTFTYNSEEQVWEGTYLAEQGSYPICLNDTEVGVANHVKLQYIFIGDNNSSYTRFSITETVSVEYAGNSYTLIDSSFIQYIDVMYIDSEQVEPTSYYTFNSVGEHTVKIFMDTSKVTTMEYMFCDCYNLTSIIFSESFDTSKVTNMSYMFSQCSSLTSLDLNNFNTSNVIYMDYMFNNCTKLTSLDLSSFDTSKVTSMYEMFYYCTNLTSIIFSELFDTSKVTTMEYMFYQCSGLTSLDLSSFDTSKITSMYYMFRYCQSLTSITFGDKANVSNVTSYYNMFYGLPSNLIFNYDCNYNYSILLNYDNTSFNGYKNCITKEQTWLVKVYDHSTSSYSSDLILALSNGVQGVYDETKSGYTFTFTNVKDVPTYDILMNGEVIGQVRCDKFDYGFVINLSGSYIKETINVTSTYSSYSLMNGYTSYMSDMFIDGIKQDNIVSSYTFNEIGEHEVIYVVDSAQTLTSCYGMFDYCNSLTSLDLSNFDTSNVTDMHNMFYYCYNLTSLDLSNFDTSKVTSMNNMFQNCRSLTSLNVSSFDTSNVTDMSYMFNSCSGLTSLDLSSFDTSNVTDMSYMFNSCSGLTSLDLSSFNTSKVTTMSTIFSNCSGLTSIIFSESFDTSKVTTMYNMFQNCRSLTSLDLNNFNTSNVTNMEYMFSSCSGLTSLDLSSFDTSKVTSMYYMFNNCRSLTKLDLSSFDTSKVTSMYYMFYYCTRLTSVTFGNKADVSNVTSYSYMFYNVSSNGTLTYPCAYSNAWNNLLITNSGSTYFPSSWTKTCQSSEVTNKIKFIENGVELSEGNFTVNGVQCVYNSEEQVWEVTYVAEQQVYNILRDSVEVGSVNNVKKLNYVLIGTNNASYTGFTITETISASSTSSSYRLIYSSYTKYVDAMFIDGEQTTISSAKTFSSVGEHTVQMIMDTSNVTFMDYMFSGCTSLTSIEFSDNFDTSKVTNMQYMFYKCSGLTSLDLSSFNTSKVTNMYDMFGYCNGLTSIEFSDNFDTSNVIDMSYMFYYCYNLTSLDLSSFDTSKVTSMYYMFYGCSGLTSIEFGYKADVSKVTSYSSMFSSVPSTCELTLCNNVKDSWAKMSKPSNTVYVDCTEPISE